MDEKKILELINKNWADDLYNVFDFDIEEFGAYEFAEFMAQRDVNNGTILCDINSRPVHATEEQFTEFIARCFGVDYGDATMMSMPVKTDIVNGEVVAVGLDLSAVNLDDIKKVFADYVKFVKKMLK